MAALLVGASAQKYVVLSVTGKVTVENDGGRKHDLRLREELGLLSVINLPYKAQVELLNEQEKKKITLKAPGKTSLANMLGDRQNTVMDLTIEYLTYLKDRVRSNGEMTSRRYSDPATVTREVAVAKDPFHAQFDKFRQEAHAKYEKFRQEAIRKYAEFVRKAWAEFGAEPPRPKPHEKEVKPVVIPEEEQEKLDLKPIQGVPVKIEGEPIVMPDIKPQPKPIQPIKEQEQETVEYVDFTLFGTPLRVRFNGKEQFQLDDLSENTIADVYEQLASADFNNTIRDCLEIRVRHQLSDWAYMNLLEALSKACFSTPNEATLLMAYLAQQSGYRIRLATSGDRLYMLYATEHMIYGRGYYTLNGTDFYVYGEDADHLKICEVNYPEEQSMSLFIPQPMLLAEERTSARELKSRRYADMDVTADVNKNLLDFYEHYPTSMIGNDLMSRWAMYANVPFDANISNTLVAQLRKKISGLNELDAMERLLNWVQTAFVYEYDDKVWGGDRAFFPEETLYYPYCDCEDRSILLSRLVRDLLGLKCVLIYYPGHLAMAVRFNSDAVQGDYVVLGNERYIVCDPTYIGARVGMTMPGMDNQTAKAILLQ